MQLTKHHGLGNDFLVAARRGQRSRAEVDGELARRVCDRAPGIGADGLIHGAAARARRPEADVVMHLYNADGSPAEMSGNGIRCLAQAVALARDGASCTVPVATDAGRAPGRAVAAADADDRVAQAEATWARCAPVRGAPAVVSAWAGPGPAQVRPLRHRRHGQPPPGRRGRRPAAVDLADDGRLARGAVPRRASTSSSSLAAADGVTGMRVWERGAGITEACGTGACAAAVGVHA